MGYSKEFFSSRRLDEAVVSKHSNSNLDMVDGLNFPFPLDHSSITYFVDKFSRFLPTMLKLLTIDELFGFLFVEGSSVLVEKRVGYLGFVDGPSKVLVEFDKCHAEEVIVVLDVPLYYIFCPLVDFPIFYNSNSCLCLGFQMTLPFFIFLPLLWRTFTLLISWALKRGYCL